jgi:uncharacterized membrane protein YbhN (UPF0104 family)
MKHDDRRKWARSAVVALAALAALYAGATAWIGRDGWRAAGENLSPTDLAVVLGLVLAGFLLRAGRWNYYMRAVGWNVPFFAGFSAFVASIALTATPGKAGELVKAALLRERYPVSLSQGAGILFVERLGDLAAVALLAVSGLALFVGAAGYTLAAGAATIVLGAVVSHPRLASAALERLAAAPRLAPLCRRLLCAIDAARLLMRPAPIVVGGALALAAWSCEAEAFHLLIGRLGVVSSAPTSFSIYALATLVGALSMLPGGVGGVEVTMGFLLARLGAPTGAAAVAVVIFRFSTLWLFSLIGLLFMVGWMTSLSRREAIP